MIARELRLYHRLQLAAHLMQKFADRRLGGDPGLTTAQAAVLSVVAGEPGVTQREVAWAIGVNESAATPMVTRLLKAGLLARARKDSRSWSLSLTHDGERALGAAKVQFAEVNALFGAALDDAETRQLVTALDRISGLATLSLDGKSGNRRPDRPVVRRAARSDGLDHSRLARADPSD